MAHLTGVFQRGSAFCLRIVPQRGLAKCAEVFCGFMVVIQLPELAPAASAI